MIGRSIAEVFGEQFHAARRALLERCLAGQAGQADFVLNDGGKERLVNTAFIPHLREQGVVGAYLFTTDVTAARQQEASLHSLANTDALTGLPNRRSYQANLLEAISKAHSGGSAIALMYLDIDHFKHINDTLGHACGDDVLQEFSRRLLAVVRKTDRVYRLAGDEFTILLEGVPTLAVCRRLGDHILSAMGAPFHVGSTEQPVSTSIGIAWSGDGNIDAQALGASADAALYRAKDAGRGQSCSVDATRSA